MLSEHSIFEKPHVRLGLILLIIAVVGATGYRTWKEWSPPSSKFDWDRRGHSDFHYGTYQPTRAFIDGNSPYTMDVCEPYQMPRPVPAFSPAAFIVHTPFGLLDLKTSNVLFFIFNLFLVAAIALLSYRFVDEKIRLGILLSVLLMLLLSRPGHQTLFTGYFTAECAIGTLLALHFARTKPWLSGVGLLLTSFKPNFLIPLAILMVCRRDFRAVVYGGILCAIGVVVGLGWLASFSSPAEVIQGVLSGNEAHENNPNVAPENTWVRIDLIGMIYKAFGGKPDFLLYLLTMVPMLGIPGWYLWHYGKQNYRYGASDVSGLLIGLTMLLALYHSTYDALILAAPFTAMLFYGPKVMPELSNRSRFWIGSLIAVSSMNYLATLSGKKLLNLSTESLLWQWLSVLSGICLLLALILLVAMLFTSKRLETQPADSLPGVPHST